MLVEMSKRMYAVAMIVPRTRHARDSLKAEAGGKENGVVEGMREMVGRYDTASVPNAVYI